MMGTLDSRPQAVDLNLYGGDSFSLMVQAPASVTDVMTVWTAQIRSSRASDVVDAVFTVAPPKVPGGPAYLTLTGEQTALLLGIGPVSRLLRDGTVLAVAQQYVGERDCQVADPSGEPVRSLVQGKITVSLDVTRP